RFRLAEPQRGVGVDQRSQLGSFGFVGFAILALVEQFGEARGNGVGQTRLAQLTHLRIGKLGHPLCLCSGSVIPLPSRNIRPALDELPARSQVWGPLGVWPSRSWPGGGSTPPRRPAARTGACAGRTP